MQSHQRVVLQIESEMAGCLDFLQSVYETFGFTFELKLSTMPEKALGSKETWDKAEAALARSLDAFGKPWVINPGDGAFYGPKVCVCVCVVFTISSPPWLFRAFPYFEPACTAQPTALCRSTLRFGTLSSGRSSARRSNLISSFQSDLSWSTFQARAMCSVQL
jgi:hypothetical protein